MRRKRKASCRRTLSYPWHRRALMRQIVPVHVRQHVTQVQHPPFQFACDADVRTVCKFRTDTISSLSGFSPSLCARNLAWWWWFQQGTHDDMFFHTAATVHLIRVTEHLRVRLRASPPPALDNQQLLAIEGLRWDPTFGWTESEKCRISALVSGVHHHVENV